VLINFLKQSWLVIVSSLVFGVLVAVVHGQLAGRIGANERSVFEGAMQATFVANARSQERSTVDGEGNSVPYYLVEGPEGQKLGYAIEIVGSGFVDKIKLLVSVGPKAEKILGIAVLKSSETPGYGDDINDPLWEAQFAGAAATEKLEVITTGDVGRVDNQIVAITGATISSEAVASIVNKAIGILRGAVEERSVDDK